MGVSAQSTSNEVGVLQLQGKFMWVIVIMAVVIVVIVVLFLSFLAYHCHQIKKRLVVRRVLECGGIMRIFQNFSEIYKVTVKTLA